MVKKRQKIISKTIALKTKFQPVYDGDDMIGVNLVEYFPDCNKERVIKCFIDMDALVTDDWQEDMSEYLDETLFD